jgi:hypothetical protein
MALAGAPDSLGILVPFLIITLLNLFMAGVLLRNVKPAPAGASIRQVSLN